VKIKNLKNGQMVEYTIVSENESDLKAGKIAVTTPIAKGLLGKKVGDVVDIRVPSGIMSYEVIAINI
jgi:transcription elongation factor GreA